MTATAGTLRRLLAASRASGVDVVATAMARYGRRPLHLREAEAQSLVAELEQARPTDTDVTPWPELAAWVAAMASRAPGESVPPCPTPAQDPDGQPYGTAYTARLRAEVAARHLRG